MPAPKARLFGEIGARSRAIPAHPEPRRAISAHGRTGRASGGPIQHPAHLVRQFVPREGLGDERRSWRHNAAPGHHIRRVPGHEEELQSRPGCQKLLLQFQQRIKTRLAFTNDAEWAAVQPLIQKVMEARRETMASGMGMGRFGGRPSGNGEGNPPAGGDTRANAFKPAPEAESLQKLIDDKVPAAELKAALEKYRASRKEKDAKLAAAQDDLRKVLTIRQEAQAALLGLVP